MMDPGWWLVLDDKGNQRVIRVEGNFATSVPEYYAVPVTRLLQQGYKFDEKLADL